MKLYDFTGAQVDQMIVLLFFGVFVTGAAVSEVMFFNQSLLLQ